MKIQEDEDLLLYSMLPEWIRVANQMHKYYAREGKLSPDERHRSAFWIYRINELNSQYKLLKQKLTH